MSINLVYVSKPTTHEDKGKEEGSTFRLERLFLLTAVTIKVALAYMGMFSCSDLP